jgi:hypothetical protein
MVMDVIYLPVRAKRGVAKKYPAGPGIVIN